MPKEYKNKVKKNSTGKIKSSPKNLKQDNILKKKGGAGKAELEIFYNFYMENKKLYDKEIEWKEKEWKEKKENLLKINSNHKLFKIICDLLNYMWEENKKLMPTKDDNVYRNAIFYELLSLIDKIINNDFDVDKRFKNNNVQHHLFRLFYDQFNTLFIHLMYISYLLKKRGKRGNLFFWKSSLHNIVESKSMKIIGFKVYHVRADNYLEPLHFPKSTFTKLEYNIFAILVELQRINLPVAFRNKLGEALAKSIDRDVVPTGDDNGGDAVDTISEEARPLEIEEERRRAEAEEEERRRAEERRREAEMKLGEVEDREAEREEEMKLGEVEDREAEREEEEERRREAEREEEEERRRAEEERRREAEMKLGEVEDMDGGGNKKIKKNKRIIKKKEVLGKLRCIYKLDGDRKEYIKYKGILIHVKEYKEKMKKNKSTKGSK